MPVVTGFTAAGLQGVSSVPFGVKLEFKPVITDKVHPPRCQWGYLPARPREARCRTAPRFPASIAKVQTTVEIREGQTMAMAGLIQNNYGATRPPHTIPRRHPNLGG